MDYVTSCIKTQLFRCSRLLFSFQMNLRSLRSDLALSVARDKLVPFESRDGAALRGWRSDG